MSDSYHRPSQGTLSPALLARLSKRFAGNPGHAAWLARQADRQILAESLHDGAGDLRPVQGVQQDGAAARADGQLNVQPARLAAARVDVEDVAHAHDSRAVPAPAQGLPRGGHTELSLDRFTHEDARIRRGGGLPACGSFFS